MQRTILLAMSLFAFTQVGGCGDDSDDGGGGGGGGGGSESATLTYPNGHPLNWISSDPTTLTNEDQVLTLTNNHRVSLMPPAPALVHDLLMRQAARGHSRHMRGDIHDFFAHLNPENDQPWDRLTKNGVVWTSAGENIAAGYPDATSVFNAWLASPGHRANIENAGYGRIGVGYSPGGGGSGYSTYWTQKFAN